MLLKDACDIVRRLGATERIVVALGACPPIGTDPDFDFDGRHVTGNHLTFESKTIGSETREVQGRFAAHMMLGAV